MYTDKNVKLINYLIASIPLSLILGNLVINLNILLVCAAGIIIFKSKIFFIENRKIQFLIYSFFFYLILVTLINNISNFEVNNLYKEHFFKSIFFLRFLILFLIINKLVENGNFNFKLFFLSSALFSSLLGVDIIIQVIFGKDILGYEIELNRPSGFFGSELIAGGYLQKFILFLIFFLATLIKKIHNKNKLLLSLYIICFFPIIITGNKMATLIYVFSCVSFFLIEKKIKEIFIVIFTILIIGFLTIKHPSFKRLNIELKIFAKDTTLMLKHAPKLFYYSDYFNEEINFVSGYLIHFNSGVQVWKQNKFFGKGIKSFQLNCKYVQGQTCNTHPHNYFIEIMLSTGLIGLILIYTIFFLGLLNFLKNYNYLNQKLKFTYLPFFLIICFEFFPLRSSGSFFTTNNSVVIFLMLSIFLNIQKIKKTKNLYKI